LCRRRKVAARSGGEIRTFRLIMRGLALRFALFLGRLWLGFVN
jgi:hypothetical protein